MAAGGGKSNFDCYFLCGKSESDAGDERRVTWVNRSPGTPPPLYAGSMYNTYISYIGIDIKLITFFYILFEIIKYIKR